MSAPAPYRLEPLFRMAVQASVRPVIGIPQGDMVVIDVGGGTIAGRINGKVAASGGDWLKVTPGGGRIDVRLVIETDDGATILMRYTGVAPMRGSEQRGEVAAMFEAPAGDYAWLNDTLAVGYSTGLGEYEFHELF